MGTDVSAYITRKEIQQVVGLLGVTPEDSNECVYIDSNTINGQHENPVGIHRAARQVAEERDDEDFDPGTSLELFDIDYEFDDYDNAKRVVTAIEEHDPDADRRIAQEIVRALTERFGIEPPGLTDLGLTGGQAAELIRLGAAVCVGYQHENDAMAWALDFFADTEAILDLGADYWMRLPEKFGPQS
ncbi:hypothetical protein [Streptosporangium sp. H16]|uniref:hypothetical protein n=1 Tax=Streptosporangium sp. H16 TaxID=3444184 RepID=UPI003F796CC8